MKSRKPQQVEARALISHRREGYLIVRPLGEPDAPWEFPGGTAAERESPEAALRRCCRAQIGVELEIVVGQPPFAHETEAGTTLYRYYVCGVLSGEPRALSCRDTRWVMTPQLRDYVFSAPTQQVVDWLLEEHSRR